MKRIPVPFRLQTVCVSFLVMVALIASSLVTGTSSVNAVGTSVTASSGSASAIQAAADSVYSSGGGTVYIPAGTFYLGGSVTIRSNTKLIGAGTDKTVLRTSGTSQIIRVEGNNTRLSGFSLISTNYDGGNGVMVGNCVDFRIDHLHIEGYSNLAAIYVRGADARGVIDHNYIKNNPAGVNNYGVEVLGGEKWKADLQLGTQNAVFIEDNTFINCRHAVAANMGAHYVFRYNLVQQNVVGQAVDAHGPAFGSSEGTQAFEIYGNVIEKPEGYNTTAMCIRGGGGVVFGNVTRGYTYGFLFLIEYGQSGSYPLYHQPHDVYIWGNSFDGPYDVGNAFANNTSYYVKQNRDWFAYALPGYTPYTYPHPLVSGSSAPAPVPVPTPTPEPTPIPNPVPVSMGNSFGLDSGNEIYPQFGDALQSMRYQNTAGDGTLDSLSVLFDDTTPNGNVWMGVYADNNGTPGALLLDAGKTSVQNGWVTISGLELQVEQDAYYWLSYNLEETNGVRYQSGQPSDSHYRVNGYTYGPLPSEFPSFSLTNNLQYVLQASVIPTIGIESGDLTFDQHGNALQAMRFQNTADDSALHSLSILFDDATPNGNVWMGVYADNNGSPGALLLDAGETLVQNGWVTINGLELPVEKDTYYWLSYNLQETNGVRYQSSRPENSHYRVNGYAYGPLPAQFPSSSLTNNLQYVMQAGL